MMKYTLYKTNDKALGEYKIECSKNAKEDTKKRLAVAEHLKTNKDLSYVKLRHTDLSCADLSGADLSCADLRGANLSYADLRDADLRSANLCSANLRGADLCRSDLKGAVLEKASLKGANLIRADLQRADLRGANLSHVDLSEANLKNAKLSGAELLFTNLKGAVLTDTNVTFIRADNFYVHIDLKYIKFYSVSESGGYFNRCIEAEKCFGFPDSTRDDFFHTEDLIWWKKWEPIIDFIYKMQRRMNYEN